ncbi:MAG: HAD family hydrolase [Actinoallomurus sp.]
MTTEPPSWQPPPAAGEPLDAWPIGQPAAQVKGGAIVDIDGTLVDTNYQHTIAWGRAFTDHGVTVSLWQVHRHNGMGGDELVAAVAGERVEERLGDAIRDSEARHYADLIEEVKPLPGARDLLAELRRLGYEVVLASSAKLGEVERYVDLLDARDTVRAWTSEADVDHTKPDPDLITTAARRLPSAARPVVIGDATWDAIAAGRAGLPAIGLLSGGFGRDELRDAGCAVVFADPEDLLEHLEQALASVQLRGA